jgi:hypothetical protein
MDMIYRAGNLPASNSDGSEDLHTPQPASSLVALTTDVETRSGGRGSRLSVGPASNEAAMRLRGAFLEGEACRGAASSK